MNKRLEEQLKDPAIREWYERRPPCKPKPQTAVVTKLDGKIAEVARANPASVQVRVTARDEEVVVVDRPRAATVVNVTSVDENGRPKTGIAYDPRTWQSGAVEFQDGYAPSGGAVSAYDPLDALKGD